MCGGSKDKKNSDSKKPEDSDFQQQRLKAWQPLLTPTWVIGSFLAIGILFIIIGIIVDAASNSVVEVSVRYDNKPLAPTNCNPLTNCTSRVIIDIVQEMKPPVFLYYQLTNFYQNHRRYVKSRSDPQLSGATKPDVSTCEPLITYNNPSNSSDPLNGKTLYPCGLIANSRWNDSVVASVEFQGNTTQLYLEKNGIAWPTDVQTKFKWRPMTSDETNIGPNGILPNVTDEDFIVWMRTAGLPTFRKLYRKINATIPANSKLIFDIVNIFPVSSFDGEKALVLSTTSWIGGKNDFLAIAYLVVGSICILLAVAFLIKHCKSPRALGQMTYFNFSKKT